VPGDRMLLYQGVQVQRVWISRESNVEAMSEALV
jgi:shikimate 5-dehydrogenase